MCAYPEELQRPLIATHPDVSTMQIAISAVDTTAQHKISFRFQW